MTKRKSHRTLTLAGAILAGACQGPSSDDLAVPQASALEAADPLGAATRYVYREAEKPHVLTSPLAIHDESAASRGQYLQAPGGTNSTASPPSSGRAAYRLALDVAGTYKIWGRVAAPSPSMDSFWLAVDGGRFVKWNDINGGVTAYAWDDVHDSDNGGRPMQYALGAGGHTIVVAYREGGARLDELLVTNDLAFVPSGRGPQGAVAAFTASPDAGGFPLAVQLDGSGSVGTRSSATLAFNWSFGDGTTGTGNPVRHTFSATGTYLASLVVVDSSGATSAPTTGIISVTARVYSYRQAEQFDSSSSPLSVSSDGNAAGGRFIQSASADSLDSPPSGGRAIYTFNLPSPGTYKVWGRVRAPSPDADSFWVRVDGGAFTKWNNINRGLTGAYGWDDVHDSDGGGRVMQYVLGAGAHQVVVAYREHGTRLDELLVTDDLAFVPPARKALEVAVYLPRRIDTCFIGDPCPPSDATCVGLRDDSNALVESFTDESFRAVRTTDPRVPTAAKKVCISMQASDAELAAIRAELDATRNNVSSWSRGAIDLVLRPMALDRLDMEESRWGGGVWIGPWDLRPFVTPLAFAPDFNMVVPPIRDPARRLHHDLGGCGGTFGADLGLAGGGWSWVPKTATSFWFDCAEQPVFTHEWLHQVHFGVHQMSGFTDLYGSEFPACGAGDPDGRRWFPDSHQCLEDPDFDRCGQVDCGSNDLVDQHILGAHWDPGRRFVSNHCGDGVTDFSETGVDTGGTCDDLTGAGALVSQMATTTAPAVGSPLPARPAP